MKLSDWDKIGLLLDQVRWVTLERGYAGVWACCIMLYRDHGSNEAFNNLLPAGDFDGPNYRVRQHIMASPVEDQVYSRIGIMANDHDPYRAALTAFRVAYPGRALPWESEGNDEEN